jgi:CDP-diacylglycerol--serine O-phosphatidyltransferase
MKVAIPNFFTLFNLFLGVLGICICSKMPAEQIEDGNLLYASLLIFAAAVCDFLDGFFAKLLKCQSSIGKELDSLADLVSFGVLPSFILLDFLQICNWDLGLFLFLPLLMPCFVAYRLARFNSTAVNEEHFTGLSSTASGMFIAALPIICRFTRHLWLKEMILRGDVLIYTTVILSILMVCRIKFMSLKFSSWQWRVNKIRYIAIVLSITSLCFFKFEGILLVFFIYLLTSIVINLRD